MAVGYTKEPWRRTALGAAVVIASASGFGLLRPYTFNGPHQGLDRRQAMGSLNVASVGIPVVVWILQSL